MQRVRLSAQPCPIARSLDQVGDWWSVLILRDVNLGFCRFADLQGRLPIAPNMLARRLETLRRHGLLERRRYSLRPKRYAYHPSEKARDFVPVLLALGAWGNRWLAPRGAPLINVHPRTGRRIEPVVIDRRTGRQLGPGAVAIAAGPGAPASVRRALSRPLPFGAAS